MQTRCLAHRPDPVRLNVVHHACKGCELHTARPAFDAIWLQPAMVTDSGIWLCANRIEAAVQEHGGTVPHADGGRQSVIYGGGEKPIARLGEAA